jgi:ribosomal-protein-alanine N-acetyltransferase
MPVELPKDLPTLETPRLILRKLRMDDAEDMFEYAQDRELGLNGLWLPYTQLQESIDDLAEAIAAYEKGNLWDWAIEHRADRKMIGRLNFHHYRPKDASAEIGYALNRRYWGQGYGTEATGRLLHFGFEQMNLHRISAVVLTDNLASIRVLTKIGMRFEGVMREAIAIRGYHEDLHSYSILRPEWENQSSTPHD